MAGERVLVVDDEADIVELLRDVLVAEGYDVDSAPDARTALELVGGNIYDVAMIDFNLPDMDGVTLHQRIRGVDAELADATVFMSGQLQSDDHLGYYMSQSGGFLAKPFDLAEVLRRVIAALGD